MRKVSLINKCEMERDWDRIWCCVLFYHSDLIAKINLSKVSNFSQIITLTFSRYLFIALLSADDIFTIFLFVLFECREPLFHSLPAQVFLFYFSACILCLFIENYSKYDKLYFNSPFDGYCIQILWKSFKCCWKLNIRVLDAKYFIVIILKFKHLVKHKHNYKLLITTITITERDEFCWK